MNGLDWFFLLLIAGGVIRGYQKGLILQAFSLVGTIFALLAAYWFAGDFSGVLMERFPLPEEMGGGWISLLPMIEEIIYRTIAFLLLFAGIKLLLWIIARLLAGLFNIPVLSQINRFGGVLLNLVQVFLILFIGIHLLNFLPWEPGREAVRDSFVSQGVLKITPDLTEQIGNWIKNPDHSLPAR